jgi:hypothetical protein
MRARSAVRGGQDGLDVHRLRRADQVVLWPAVPAAMWLVSPSTVMASAP